MSDDPYAAPQANPSSKAAPASGKAVVAFLGRALGALLAAFALLGSVFSVLAIVDPQGAQLSNDADPFGTPPESSELWLHLALWIVLLCVGLWLFFRRRSR